MRAVMIKRLLAIGLLWLLACVPAQPMNYGDAYQVNNIPTLNEGAFALTYLTSFQCTADPCSSTVDLGLPDLNLDIVVACATSNVAAGITSITVGGVTASDDITATNSPLTLAIQRAAYPNGGSATVSCDVAGTRTDDVVVGVWRLVRASEAPGTTSDEQSATSATTVVTLNSVTIASGGGAIFVCNESDDDLDGAGLWANATQRYGIDAGTVHGSTGADSTTAGTPSATCTSTVGNDTMLGVGASYSALP